MKLSDRLSKCLPDLCRSLNPDLPVPLSNPSTSSPALPWGQLQLILGLCGGNMEPLQLSRFPQDREGDDSRSFL